MKNLNKKVVTISALGAAILLSACQSVPKATHEQALLDQKQNYEKQLQALQIEKQSVESDAALAKQQYSALAAGSSSSSSLSDQLFPPNAKPGQCWSRVLIPASYQTKSEQILVKPATEKISILPAKYETVSEQVLVKEATTQLVTVPATYKMITEQIMIKPAHKQLKRIPAQYETITESVLDKPAHTVWKRGAGFRSSALETRIDNGTGEVMCLVEVPASYKTITKTILKSPERVIEEELPAQYKTVTKRVVDQEATTRTVDVPAQYKTVQVKRLVTPEKQLRSEVPAAYRTVTSREKVTEEKMQWSQVLCEDNMSTQTVADLQELLRRAGVYGGPIDGQYGKLTERAANEYAKRNGLPTGSRLISLETAKHIGLKL
jgi:hypothetical protein